MSQLHALRNTSRPHKARKRIGRGPGSKRGKTSGRGSKGAGSRSGYKIRAGKEGGQNPLYRKLPCRGFTNARFAEQYFVLNLWQIEKHYNEGEEVNEETLRAKGILKGQWDGIKLLCKGTLTKKVAVQVNAASTSAKEKLEDIGASLQLC